VNEEDNDSIMSLRVFTKLSGLGLAVLTLAVLFNNCSAPKDNLRSSSSVGADANCPKADASLTNPQTIDAVVVLINSLPKPLTLDCFLRNLAPNQKVYAVDNNFSAQPSAGPQSPRIFLLQPSFVLSVVPAGSARNLLEMSQFTSSTQSVKAELEFPITTTLATDAPYTHILNANSSGTRCFSCHSPETAALGFGGPAYNSHVLVPDALKRVPASMLRSYAQTCASTSDQFRCAILRAIFVYGNGQDGNFP
jgi:hypothetical protein